MKRMTISVAGGGYVGLSNAVMFAQNNDVYIYDIDPDRVALINAGKSPITDRDIANYLKDKPLSLKATSNEEETFSRAEFILIATPTDYNSDTNSFDSSKVDMVLAQAARLAPSATVVIKSTIPIGYTQRMSKQYPGLTILFVPEFLREGTALYDCLYPSRVIIGTARDDAETRKRAEVFAELVRTSIEKDDTPFLFMGASEAESVKLFSNTYLALRVAFFNELDTYAEFHCLNSGEIIEGVCLDPRIGSHYNNPSFGYGGYCLPKDTKQLLASFQAINTLVQAVVEANRTRKDFIAEQVFRQAPRIAGIYRLTMKNASDNFRNSSVQGIMRRLQEKGVELVIYEPIIKEPFFYGVRVMDDLDEFKRVSDVIIANRYNSELDDVREKIYTRDIHHRD